MTDPRNHPAEPRVGPKLRPSPVVPPLDLVCPACGAPTIQVKCKVVCSRCRRIVLNCSEF